MNAPLYDRELDDVPPAPDRLDTLVTPKDKGSDKTTGKLGQIAKPGRFAEWFSNQSLPNVIGIGLALGFVATSIPMIAMEPSFLGIASFAALLLFIAFALWLRPRFRWSRVRSSTVASLRKTSATIESMAGLLRDRAATMDRGRRRIMIAATLTLGTLAILSITSQATVRTPVPRAMPRAVVLPISTPARPDPTPAVRLRGSSKVKAWHRDRLAVVQLCRTKDSSAFAEEKARRVERDMVDLALALGWPRDRIYVLNDVGEFPLLLDAMALDRVGLILDPDLRRRDDDFEDWPFFLDLCLIFTPLVAERDYVHDPGDQNDQTFLGVGGMSRTDMLQGWEKRDWARLEEKSLGRIALLDRVVAGLKLGAKTTDRAAKALKAAESTRDREARKAKFYADCRRRKPVIDFPRVSPDIPAVSANPIPSAGPVRTAPRKRSASATRPADRVPKANPMDSATSIPPVIPAPKAP